MISTVTLLDVTLFETYNSQGWLAESVGGEIFIGYSWVLAAVYRIAFRLCLHERTRVDSNILLDHAIEHVWSILQCQFRGLCFYWYTRTGGAFTALSRGQGGNLSPAGSQPAYSSHLWYSSSQPNLTISSKLPGKILGFWWGFLHAEKWVRTRAEQPCALARIFRSSWAQTYLTHSTYFWLIIEVRLDWAG